jgi:hypothetical protein
MSGTAPSAVPEVSGLPLPQLLRQETGEAGHENIAAFVNDAFGTEKSAVLSTLSKVSAAYKDGRISFEEKDRLKGLLLTRKDGIDEVQTNAAAFSKEDPPRTCQVCMDDEDQRGIVCGSGHYTCLHCLSAWARQCTFESLGEARQSGSEFDFHNLYMRAGHICCPASKTGHCTAGPYEDHQVTRLVSNDLACRFLTTLLHATESNKRIQDTQEHLLNAIKGEDGESNPSVERAKRAIALKKAVPNGRMCAMCNFGPMINVNCNDMTTHGDEANNSCPRCGFASARWSDYPLWDGRLPEETVVLNAPATGATEPIDNDKSEQGNSKDGGKGGRPPNTAPETSDYSIITPMGKAKLVAPRHDGVKVLELAWKLANGARAKMYTRIPIVQAMEKKPLFVEIGKKIEAQKAMVRELSNSVKFTEERIKQQKKKLSGADGSLGFSGRGELALVTGDTVFAKATGWTKWYRGKVQSVGTQYKIHFEDGERKDLPRKLIKVPFVVGESVTCTDIKAKKGLVGKITEISGDRYKVAFNDGTHRDIRKSMAYNLYKRATDRVSKLYLEYLYHQKTCNNSIEQLVWKFEKSTELDAFLVLVHMLLGTTYTGWEQACSHGGLLFEKTGFIAMLAWEIENVARSLDENERKKEEWKLTVTNPNWEAMKGRVGKEVSLMVVLYSWVMAVTTYSTIHKNIARDKDKFKKIEEEFDYSKVTEFVKLQHLEKELESAKTEVTLAEETLKSHEKTKGNLETRPWTDEEWGRIRKLQLSTTKVYKRWSIGSGESGDVKPGSICRLVGGSIKRDWIVGGIARTFRKATKSIEERNCIVRAYDENTNTLSLETGDRLQLEGVPLEKVVPFSERLGTNSWLKVRSEKGTEGWIVVGATYGGSKDNTAISLSPFRPCYPNKKDSDDLHFMVIVPTPIFSEKETKAVVGKLEQGEILSVLPFDGGGKAGAYTFTLNSDKHFQMIATGHTGQWRNKSFQHWCDRSGSQCSCRHGFVIIRKPHWSCCGATEQHSLCSCPEGRTFKVGESAYAVPWSNKDPENFDREVQELDWKKCTVESVNKDGTHNVSGHDFEEDGGEWEEYDKQGNQCARNVARVIKRYSFPPSVHKLKTIKDGVKARIVSVLNENFSGALTPTPAGETRKASFVGREVQVKYRGWRRYYGGVITNENDDGTFAVEFDDGEVEEDVCTSMIKEPLQPEVAPSFSVKSDLCTIEDGRSLHYVDVPRKLLYMSDGRTFPLANRSVPVELLEGHRNVVRTQTRRIYLPQSWEEFSTQSQLVLDCHKVLSANVMKKDGKYNDWYRAQLLNKDTYSTAIHNIEAGDVIACHQFSSPQFEEDEFPADYVFMMGELVMEKFEQKRKKGRRRNRRNRRRCKRDQAGSIGRVVGANTSGQLKIMIRDSDGEYDENRFKYISMIGLERYRSVNSQVENHSSDYSSEEEE